MSKEDLQLVIENFSDDNLNRFFRRSCDDYSESLEDLSDYDDDRFAEFRKLGEIDFGNTERLLVTSASVSTELAERSGKKAQYEKAKKILKEAGIFDAGFFIFYDDSGSFRFSLIYGQAEGTKKSWSNFRRFTYFVSSDQTNITFKKRVGECGFTSLDTIKDAFSVEKVTKDFYKQIADWYFWTVKNVKFPEAAENEENGRNIAVIRLITRLIFIWFMKERKLVSPDLFDTSKMSALLKSLKANETTYYKAILQNLFFATLNTKIEDRKFRFTGSFQGRNTDYMDHGIYRYEDYFNNQDDMLAVFQNIPFLNGGLFDCLDWSARESGTGKEGRFDGFSDKEVGLKLPNYLFFSEEREADLNKDYGTKNKKYRVQGLLNILSAYNFTIDENDPNDQEIALDPELLGKVFENLLASFNPETSTTARKATGSYYTPREIVDYMVTQSLKQYYRTHLEEIDDIDSKLDDLLSPVTDEAVNPFDDIDSKKIVQLTEALRIVDPAVGSGAFPMGILNKLVSVLSRVDPDNLTWKEAQLKAVNDVPDPLLKQKLIQDINEQFAEKSVNYSRKLYLIQKCIYGVDIQQIAIEIAKLRFFIALLVDEDVDKTNPDNWGIKPLPNLDFKLMQGNSLISEFMGINLDAEDSDTPAKLMKDETDELISRYQDKKSEYQYEPDQKKKEVLKREIEKLIEQIFESKLKTQKAEYYTKLKNIEQKYASVPDNEQRNGAIRKDTEALNRNYKFDLTQVEKQLKEFTTGLKVKPFFAWKLYFAEVFHEKKGFDIVIANPPYETSRSEGIDDSFKEYLRSHYETAEDKFDYYTFFIEQSSKIANTRGYISLITANTYLMKPLSKKIRRYLLTKCQIIIIDEFKGFVFETVVPTAIILFRNESVADEYQINIRYDVNSIDDFLKGKYKQRSENITTFRREPDFYINLYADEVFIELFDRLCKEDGIMKLGELAEIYNGIQTGNDKKFISYNKKSQKWQKVITGSDIQLYYKKWGGKYVYYVPEVLHSNTRRDIFKTAEKIIIRQTSDRIMGTYDNEGDFCLASTFIIKQFKKYISYQALLAILNSRLFLYLYRNFNNEEGRVLPQIKKKHIFGFPIKIDFIEDPFIALVDNILTITRDDDYLSNLEKQNQVRAYQQQIDQMVYELYGLMEEEIAVVEGTTK